MLSSQFAGTLVHANTALVRFFFALKHLCMCRSYKKKAKSTRTQTFTGQLFFKKRGTKVIRSEDNWLTIYQ